MGMDKTTFAVVVLPEVIACVCADFPRVFLTIVVVQNEYFGARTPKCAKWMVNISEVNYAWKKVLRKYKLCLSRICRHFGIRHSLNLVNGDTVLNVTPGTGMRLMPLSTIFQLYRGGQLYWWVHGENHRPAQFTDILYQLMYQNKFEMFVHVLKEILQWSIHPLRWSYNFQK